MSSTFAIGYYIIDPIRNALLEGPLDNMQHAVETRIDLILVGEKDCEIYYRGSNGQLELR
jgi:hypothetical protein